MRFGVLGPLVVVSDGDEMVVSGAKRRALLTRLLIDANRAIAVERLVEDLWEGAPPATAPATLQSHISHLRRVVGARLRTVPRGYAIDVDDGELDAVVFEAETAEARRLMATDPSLAAELAERALVRWRGPAFADVAGAAWAASESARLEELHLVAVECHLEARLAVGAHADVISRAEAAVAEHPLREQLWRLLVTALYRDGRQAEALRAYERLRRRLADELGIDPSPVLRALERAVLSQDPALLAPMPPAPMVSSSGSGVFTFLMTDIVGSTRLWEGAPDAMKTALARHDGIVRNAIGQHGGRVFATGGDGLAAVFTKAVDAAEAALESQAALAGESWPEPVEIRVRMGLHTGPAQERGGDFFGPALNRCARLMAIAHGGQVLCTQTTAERLEDAAAFALVDLGSHRLRDLVAPVPVLQIGDGAFPPLRSDESVATNLPTGLTDLVGRADDITALSADVHRQRIVTLTGVGGVGKTRLALSVAAAVADEFFDGAWLVELAGVARGGEVATAVATALAAPRLPASDAVGSLLSYLADRRLVLILDNCEHVLDDVAALVTAITRSTSDVHLLATSREPLGVEGEVVRVVRSLDIPEQDILNHDAQDVAAVRLFVERAQAASREFVLDDDNVEAVCDICRRLDGVPLAIELAAARVRTMTPSDIAGRLNDRFRILAGARRAHERHRTLLGTVAWSYDLLSDDERQAFAQLSVFPSTFDLAAAGAVVRVERLDTDGVIDLVAHLVDRSLVAHERASGRYRLLETIRQFSADRLAESGSLDDVLGRYVAHYMRLVTGLGPGVADHRHDEAVAALAADLENIRTTVDLLVRSCRWQELGLVSVKGWRFFTQFTPLETSDWLALALDGGGLADPEQQAEALAAMAMMAVNAGAAETGVGHARCALDLATTHGLPEPAWARFALAMISAFASDWEACLRHARAAAAAGAARGDELARAAALAQTVPPLLRDGRIDEADDAANEALEAAVRLSNSTALSAAVTCIASGYCFHCAEPDLARARELLDLHAEAAIGEYGGLNAAWLLTYRALAESDRDPHRSIRYAVEAARVADRSSPFAVGAAVQVLALACARAGLIPEARVLAAYVNANGIVPLEPSDRQWITSRVTQATASRDGDKADRVPNGRRQLLPLLAALDQLAACSTDHTRS